MNTQAPAFTLDFDAADKATQHFANMDAFRDVLRVALTASQDAPRTNNVIAWGDGGYGKSDFAFQYLQAATGITPFVVSFHKELQFDALFGGIDMLAWAQGKLRYRTEDSWINHPIVIFEEVGDAAASLLMAMKDTMTRGVFTIGEQVTVKTQFILGNTNLNPKELMVNPAIAAFAERFPYRLEVTWRALSNMQREDGFKSIVSHAARKQIDSTTQKIIYQAAALENWSPRRTIQVVRAVIAAAKLDGENVAGIDHLKVAARLLGFDSAEAMRRIADAELQANIQAFRTGIDNLFAQYQAILDAVPPTITTPAQLGTTLKNLAQMSANLDKINGHCNNARNDFGKAGNAVIDELLDKSANMRTTVQMLMLDLIPRLGFDLNTLKF